ncbi:hypothetical protein FRC19_004944, partial [Serendipita sp. 401]
MPNTGILVFAVIISPFAILIGIFSYLVITNRISPPNRSRMGRVRSIESSENREQMLVDIYGWDIQEVNHNGAVYLVYRRSRVLHRPSIPIMHEVWTTRPSLREEGKAQFGDGTLGEMQPFYYEPGSATIGTFIRMPTANQSGSPSPQPEEFPIRVVLGSTAIQVPIEAAES